MPRSPKPSPASAAPDLEALAVAALAAWDRQGEAEQTDASGVRWRFMPEHQPLAALRIEARQGIGDAEVLVSHTVPGSLLGCEQGADALAASLASISAQMASD